MGYPHINGQPSRGIDRAGEGSNVGPFLTGLSPLLDRSWLGGWGTLNSAPGVAAKPSGSFAFVYPQNFHSIHTVYEAFMKIL